MIPPVTRIRNTRAAPADEPVPSSSGLSDRPRRLPGTGAFARSRIVGIDVDVLDDVADTAAGAFAGGLFDDQRDVNRFVVEEQPVLLLAVIAKAFAVIRQQDDGRFVVELVRLQIAHAAARRSRPRTRSRRRRSVLGELCRRRVGRVRIVQVQEQEHARRALLVEPRFGDRFDVRAVALDRGCGAIGLRASGISSSKNSNPWRCRCPCAARTSTPTPPVA